MRKNTEVYSDLTLIASKFNNFFANIGPSLANNVPPSPFARSDFFVHYYLDCLFLTPTSPTKVAFIGYTLKNSKCEGFDGLCISSLKETIDLLATSLSHICSLSFSSGLFPDALKIAKVFQFLSLATLLYSQTTGLFLAFQVFLKSLRSSITFDHLGFSLNLIFTIIININNIYEGFEKKEFTIAVFLDLKKAFDTVNYEILSNKLNYYGICGIPLAWLASYLTNRQQYVMICHQISSKTKVVCGVPQGLVLSFFSFISMIFFSPLNILHLSYLLMIQTFSFVIKTYLLLNS